MPMSNQEIYDKVAAHLLAQNERSTHHISGCCAYRGLDGLKCAIGALIKDEFYHQGFEGNGLYGNADILGALVKSGVIDTPIDERTINLLVSLQAIHDSFRPEQWHEELIITAKELGLTPIN